MCKGHFQALATALSNTMSGGPMYYLTKGFAERGLPGGKILAVMFSIFCILGALGGGNMFQANQAHQQISGIVGAYPGWITGVIFALVVFAVIIGSLKSIARVTEKVVPFMGVMYVLAALIIILANADMIGWAFGQIFAGAFTGLGVAGGRHGRRADPGLQTRISKLFRAPALGRDQEFQIDNVFQYPEQGRPYAGPFSCYDALAAAG